MGELGPVLTPKHFWHQQFFLLGYQGRQDSFFTPSVFFQGSREPSSLEFLEVAKEQPPSAARASQISRVILKLTLPIGNFKTSVLSLFHWSLRAFKLRKQRKINHCLQLIFLGLCPNITLGFERGGKKILSWLSLQQVVWTVLLVGLSW